MGQVRTPVQLDNHCRGFVYLPGSAERACDRVVCVSLSVTDSHFPNNYLLYSFYGYHILTILMQVHLLRLQRMGKYNSYFEYTSLYWFGYCVLYSVVIGINFYYATISVFFSIIVEGRKPAAHPRVRPKAGACLHDLFLRLLEAHRLL